MEGERRRMRSGTRSLSRRVRRLRVRRLRVGRREGVVLIPSAPQQTGTSPKQHPRRDRLGPAADSGRLLCGKYPDGPTEGHILGALGRCARPGRTLRA